MKKTIYALLALIIISCSNEADKKTETTKYDDLFVYNLKGNVTTVEESIFVVDSNGNNLPDSVSTEFGEFKDGYLQTYTSTDSSGKNKMITHYLHYDNGSWKGYYSVTNGKLNDSTAIYIDSAGKYSSGNTYDSARKLTEIVKDLLQNEYTMVTEGKVYDASGKLLKSFTNIYDKQNYLGGIVLDSAGKETSKTVIKLNDKADAIEETSTSKQKDSAITEVKKYRYDSYDETGNWTQRTQLDKNDKPVKIVKRKLSYVAKKDD